MNLAGEGSISLILSGIVGVVGLIFIVEAFFNHIKKSKNTKIITK